jgi:anthranilate phosphoribosyltransferase
MVTAFILATTKPGKEKETLVSLVNLNEIKDAYTVYGDYDIVLHTETKDLDDLNNFLLKKLRDIPSIAATTTMIAL